MLKLTNLKFLIGQINNLILLSQFPASIKNIPDLLWELDSVEILLRGDAPVAEFVERYIDAWRAERDSGVVLQDDRLTRQKLSSIFCVVDMYNPEPRRIAPGRIDVLFRNF